MPIQQVDLVGDSRPVVTPAATAAMAQAVRDGTISILDIMDRVSARSKAKEELELVTAQQGIEEATNPELIQAKRSQQLLAGDQAQQTRELLPLARRATEEKLNADIRSGQIARYGLKEKLEALNNVGFAPAPDPDKGITPEFALEVNKKFGTMLRWQKKKADGIFNAALFDAGELVTPAGTFRGPMDKATGAPADPKQISSWRKDAAMTLPEFLLAEPPGGVVEPVTALAPAVVISPAVAAQQRAQLSNQGVPNAASLTDLQVSELIQPAQQSVSVVRPSGVPPGFIQVKPAPVTAESTALVKRTDALQRELINLDSIQGSINQARSLAVPGIVGPGQIGVTRGMHQLLAAFGVDSEAQKYTSQDQLNTVISNEIADFVRDWKGAISDKELRFFQSARPRIDSTPERWSTYLDEWQAKNEKLKKIVVGELAPDDPTAWAANPKSQSVGSAQVMPASAAENTTVLNGQTYKVRADPATGVKRYFIVK